MRILLADDHPLFREGIIAVLQGYEGLEIVGEAESGGEALRLAESLQPDLILMDISMPGVNGIEATRQIIATSPHIRILILTMFDDDNSVFSAIRAGARGYLLKGAKPKEIIRALVAVADGEAIFSPGIASKMMYYFDAIQRPPQKEIFPELTARETEILEQLAIGKTISDLALLFQLSLKTVRNHVSNILNKLQVVDRAQAILLAREAGLGSVPGRTEPK
ncbi:response regulator transcription factor [Paenibacillus mesophilus]|uniref:response regulator transcription factor n=1 Tax=Paenibacillus mesophilus TaxID=2582849 RepID=UPI00110DBED8|nr:response regulator transcription factor [Paenibacillus mesophilus]TMV44848.1 response regulator transcription factor [Paenibacillus mesophilus]